VTIQIEAAEAAHPSARPKRAWYRLLYVQILFAIFLGGLIGHFFPATGEAMRPLGDGFIKLVKMVIAPVIFLTVVTGIAGMRSLQSLGSVAAKAFTYFIVVSTFALFVGLAVGNLVKPGAGMDVDPESLDAGAIATFVERAHDQTVTGFLLNVIPDTIVGAFARGEILQVLFFAVLFGICLGFSGPKGSPILSFFHSMMDVFFHLVHMLMKAAPIGAFGAFAFTIGRYGIDSVVNLAALVATFYTTAALFIIVVLGAIARACGFSIFKLMRYLQEELLLVLGTSSSESALPSLMQKLERAGCAKQVVGLVVPTGYSFNLDGTNIYMTLAVLFIAQAIGVDLSLSDQMMLMLVAVLSSKGAAGVTGAGFITLAATLTVLPTVPVAGLALVLGVDRFMSECRSITNFIGNAVATIVVSRWQGALDHEQLHAALDGRAHDAFEPDSGRESAA
jgi:aerobic C4-dicarboxylate transport protein